MLKKPNHLVSLAVPALEERAPPRTSSRGRPACRSLSKDSAVKALLKKGKLFTLPAPQSTRWKMPLIYTKTADEITAINVSLKELGQKARVRACTQATQQAYIHVWDITYRGSPTHTAWTSNWPHMGQIQDL